MLLFQSGYLTIDKYINNPIFGINEYKLKIPNLEIQISLNRLFLDYLTNNVKIDNNIIYSLLESDLDNFKNIMSSMFASIPYNNYVNNKIGEYEGYYASVFFSYLAGAGLEIIPEDITNNGRIDLTIKMDNAIYILEFKLKDKNNPLQQIKDRKYYEKYQTENKDIYVAGIEFDEKKKNINSFEWEKIK